MRDGDLPADVQFPFAGPADIFTPRYFEFSLMTPQRLRLGVGYLNLLARLRPETTLSAANAAARGIRALVEQTLEVAPLQSLHSKKTAAPQLPSGKD